jgi:hypothetical protein
MRGSIGDNFVRLNDFPSGSGESAADFPDPQPAWTFENVEFFVGIGGLDPTKVDLGFVTVHRGRPVSYTNCTVEILEPDSTPGVPALPAGNVAPIPT